MTRPLAISALSLLFVLGQSAIAQEATPPKPAEVKTETPDPKTVAFEKFVKDLKKIDGAMPLYLNPASRTAYLEVPESRLNQVFLIQAALHTGLDSGFLSAGMPVGGNAVDAFKWVKNDETLLLVRPNLAYRYRADSDFGIGAERTFPEATLGTYPIAQSDPGRKRFLINVTPLFYGDVFHLNEMIMEGLGGPYQVERDKSGVLSANGSDDLMVVRMKLQYTSPRGGGGQSALATLLGVDTSPTLADDRSAPLEVTYTMGYRNDSGFKPRVSDPRVGFFTESFFTVDRFLKDDRTERYINRWQLAKRDPSAPLSEPVKPIVWTLDPSIPAEFRPAVKEGILRWNRAFEKLGYKNAIQVEDAPKGEDYDHADGRRNVVRLLVGPSAPFAAISLFRTDPFTGQILNASITLDGNVIRDIENEHARVVAGMANNQAARMSILRRDAARTATDDFTLFATPQERVMMDVAERLRKYGWSHAACEHASELKAEADLMWYALQQAPNGSKLNKIEYVKRFLADCICHEMGHCLGLRHNFAGSTELTTAQLGDDSLTAKTGLSSSVMDYNPPNVMAILRGRGNYYSSTIGAYDEWAIKYGYSDFGAGRETAGLAAIARESGAPGHAYITDEDADRTNPYGVRFDGAKDPLNYSARVLLAMRRTMAYAEKNLPKPGESYSKRTGVILSALSRSVREGRNAARFVGGVVTTKNFRGDVGEKPTIRPVDPTLQRQAMQIIAANFLAPTALRFSPKILESLSSDENDTAWNAPMRDIIGGQQQNLLALLLSASTTDRIAENELKQPGGYQLAEHFGVIKSNVFAEVGSGVAVSPLRRDLQRFTLSAWMAQSSAPQGAINEDVRTLASQTLRQLDQQIIARLGKPQGLDTMTVLHWKDAHDTLHRFFDREMVVAR